MRYERDPESGLIVPRRRIERVREHPSMLPYFQQGQFGRAQQISGDEDPGYAFSRVQLLLPFNNQTNGSDVYIDESSYAVTVNFGGNVNISTARSAFAGTGEGSAQFSSSGTNGQLNAALANSFNRRTGRWCVETHAYLTQVTFFCLFAANATGNASGSDLCVWRSNATGNFQITDGTTTATILGSSAGFSANTWVHLALTFDGGTYRYFVDGVLAGSTSTLMASGTLNEVRIGEAPFAGAATDGFLDNFRVTTGTTVYSSSGFTPPSAPHPEA